MRYIFLLLLALYSISSIAQKDEVPTGLTLSQYAFDTLQEQICSKAAKVSYVFTAEDALQFVRMSNTLGKAKFKKAIQHQCKIEGSVFKTIYPTREAEVRKLLVFETPQYSSKCDIYWDSPKAKSSTNSHYSPIK